MVEIKTVEIEVESYNSNTEFDRLIAERCNNQDGGGWTPFDVETKGGGIGSHAWFRVRLWRVKGDPPI